MNTLSLHERGVSPQAADLLALIGADVPLRRAASTDGGEYTGPCPWCQGTDRFHAWPLSDRPRYWCRQCDRKGDAIQYLRDRHGLTYPEAVRQLGGDVPERPLARRVATPPPPRVDTVPPASWRDQAAGFVAWCRGQLFGPAGAPALAYLRDVRGYCRATIEDWELGYCPVARSSAGARWGVDDDWVHLPRGIVIPCRVEGDLWYVKVRQPLPASAKHPEPDDLAAYIGPTPGASAKYLLVKGGAKLALFGARTLNWRDVAVLTEGEFDAILLDQEAGNRVGVATMGGATNPLDGRWLWQIGGRERVLVAYDNDPEGRAGAEKIRAISPRFRPAIPLGAKDLTELHRSGGDLRAWLGYHLDRLLLERQTNEGAR